MFSEIYSSYNPISLNKNVHNTTLTYKIYCESVQDNGILGENI